MYSAKKPSRLTIGPSGSVLLVRDYLRHRLEIYIHHSITAMRNGRATNYLKKKLEDFFLDIQFKEYVLLTFVFLFSINTFLLLK